MTEPTRVVITGCGSGFGRLSALDLARRGARVFATVRNPSRAADLALVALEEELPLSVHLLDVRMTSSVSSAIEEIVADGPIDVLVNNAGYALRGPLETLSDEEISTQFDTNVTGILRMVREVVPHMRSRGRGTIVNVSSLSGMVGIPFEGAYSASKHAVESISESLSFELAPAGIRVLLIEPGAYETGFVDNTIEAIGFTSDHPSWTEYHSFWDAAAGLTGGERSDPAAVVAAIRRAVLDSEAPFRQLVGDDAEFVVNQKLDARTDDFAPVIRSVLGLPLPETAG